MREPTREEIVILGEFMREYPEPDPEAIKDFVEENNISLQDLSTVMYYLLGMFFGAGEALEHDEPVNEEQLKMGIAVEYEHTTCSVLAERIARDHLAEIPDYYTRLKAMEDGAGKVARKVVDDEDVSINATEIAVGRLL